MVGIIKNENWKLAFIGATMSRLTARRRGQFSTTFCKQLNNFVAFLQPAKMSFSTTTIKLFYLLSLLTQCLIELRIKESAAYCNQSWPNRI